jgi:two-component system, response regulator, stage 0 sporulation protein F
MVPLFRILGKREIQTDFSKLVRRDRMRSRKILIAEDEDLLRMLYKEELEEAGYEVITAENGKEALHQIESAKPDIVVLDIAMPVMDGLEALRRIKGKHNGIPVVLHTAHPAYLATGRARAADACIVKCGDLKELKKILLRLLN